MLFFVLLHFTNKRNSSGIIIAFLNVWQKRDREVTLQIMMWSQTNTLLLVCIHYSIRFLVIQLKKHFHVVYIPWCIKYFALKEANGIRITDPTQKSFLLINIMYFSSIQIINGESVVSCHFMYYIWFMAFKVTLVKNVFLCFLRYMPSVDFEPEINHMCLFICPYQDHY